MSRQPGVQTRRKSSRWNYYRRIFSAYLGSGTSQLTFWHDHPEVNPDFQPGTVGPYYMTFTSKADYAGPFDQNGIPLLDYRGVIGPQYNPIAIAQYGLGNYNQYARTRDSDRRATFLRAADWLASTLEPNAAGLWMWMHKFDWEYRDTLYAPWYSGLAQGQGISLLLRAYKETGSSRYLEGAQRAFGAFLVDVRNGGVACRDEQDHLWFEEYIVFPPTHVLNGFIWALWGIYDYSLLLQDQQAGKLFSNAVETLRHGLPRFDLGFWSLYEQSGLKWPMIASHFYHKLHIVQLRIMHRLTGESFFSQTADRWQSYEASWWNRQRALIYKAAFKLRFY